MVSGDIICFIACEQPLIQLKPIDCDKWRLHSLRVGSRCLDFPSIPWWIVHCKINQFFLRVLLHDFVFIIATGKETKTLNDVVLLTCNQLYIFGPQYFSSQILFSYFSTVSNGFSLMLLFSDTKKNVMSITSKDKLWLLLFPSVLSAEIMCIPEGLQHQGFRWLVLGS